MTSALVDGFIAANCDEGDDISWDERWRAGEDMDAWRRDGVAKLVNPAWRDLVVAIALLPCAPVALVDALV
jgi:hypothetical protein